MKGSIAFSARSRTIRARCFLNLCRRSGSSSHRCRHGTRNWNAGVTRSGKSTRLAVECNHGARGYLDELANAKGDRPFPGGIWTDSP